MHTLTDRIRYLCCILPTRPFPLSDAIPVMQQAADVIDAKDVEIAALKQDAETLQLVIRLEISLELDADIQVYIHEYNGEYSGEYEKGVEAWFVTETGEIIKAQELYNGDKNKAVRLAVNRVAEDMAQAVKP